MAENRYAIELAIAAPFIPHKGISTKSNISMRARQQTVTRKLIHSILFAEKYAAKISVVQKK